jgi:hypothetical protein
VLPRVLVAVLGVATRAEMKGHKESKLILSLVFHTMTLARPARVLRVSEELQEVVQILEIGLEPWVRTIVKRSLQVSLRVV